MKNTIKLWLRARNLNRLKNKYPIILSDNCWGGSIYSFLHMEYYSPLVGTYVYPESFLNLVEDFPKSFLEPLEFTSKPSHPRREDEPEYYPVGLISDSIEIHFLHYKSEAEALKKWNRRTQRMLKLFKTSQKDFLKMDDSNYARSQDFTDFHNLKNGYKISFSKDKLINHPNHFEIKLKNEWVSGKNSSYNLDVIHWLNTGEAKQTLINKCIRPIYKAATYA